MAENNFFSNHPLSTAPSVFTEDYQHIKKALNKFYNNVPILRLDPTVPGKGRSSDAYYLHGVAHYDGRAYGLVSILDHPEDFRPEHVGSRNYDGVLTIRQLYQLGPVVFVCEESSRNTPNCSAVKVVGKNQDDTTDIALKIGLALDDFKASIEFYQCDYEEVD